VVTAMNDPAFPVFSCFALNFRLAVKFVDEVDLTFDSRGRYNLET
jgi:hypothetical protein